jgi:predicted GH43/DUF377 family glycosyl hydrolase
MGLKSTIERIKRSFRRKLRRFAFDGWTETRLLEAIETLKHEHELHLRSARKDIMDLAEEFRKSARLVAELMKFAPKQIPPIGQQTLWETGIVGLPSHPDYTYFNPAITKAPDGRVLMFTRRCKDKRREDSDYFREKNDIVVFDLDEKTMRATSMTPLGLRKQEPMEQFEDPRIIRFGNGYGLSCCAFVQGRSYAHQSLFLLDENFNCVNRYDPIYGHNMAQAMGNSGHEKNWLWFSHDGSPHMIYSASPHKVIQMDGLLNPVKEFETNVFDQHWKYGEVRGGTNPIRVDDVFWTFFHSSVKWAVHKRRYFLGAYAFEAKPPFRIVRFTGIPLLTGTSAEHWWPGLPEVVFPCGAYFDGDNKQFVVSYGVNDVLCGYLKIPLTDLESASKQLRYPMDIVSEERRKSIEYGEDLVPPFHKQKKENSRYDRLVQRLEVEQKLLAEGSAGEREGVV